MSGRHRSLPVRARRLAAVVTTAVLVAASAVTMVSVAALTTAPAEATTPGSAGTPQAPAVIYSENFENGTGTTPVLLTAYTGAAPTNMTYTADADWLTACNGNVLEYLAPDTSMSQSTCTAASSFSNVRQEAWAMGTFVGSSTPGQNHALTALTDANPQPNGVMIKTATNVPVSANGRYLTVSFIAAAINCTSPGAVAPLISPSLVDASGAEHSLGSNINTCTDPRGTAISAPHVGTQGPQTVQVGRYSSDGAILWNSASVGFVVRNGQSSGVGNDGSIDDIQILDATPQVDKSFSPAAITAGGTSTLTFTITNTTELAAKNGWDFNDNLPAGVQVASSPNPTTTCLNPAGDASTSATVTATAGSGTVGVNGSLGEGMASCTVAVQVTSSVPGTYTNTGCANPDGSIQAGCTSNFEPIVGLNPPGAATLTVARPQQFDCTVPTIFDANGTPTQLDQQFQSAAGATFTPLGANPDGWTYNAIAYNPTDRYIYAVSRAVNGHPVGDLLQIAGDGSIVDLGPITGLPPAELSAASGGPNAGVVDSDGNYWIGNSNESGILYEINLGTRAATALPGQSTGIGSSDVTFADGFFWGIVDWAGQIQRIDPATGAATTFPRSVTPFLHTGTAPSSTGVYGAGWTYGNGNLGFDENSGGLIQISIANPAAATPTFTQIGTASGPASGNNDGTACSQPASLSIAKTASTTSDSTAGATVSPGGVVTWTLTATNDGPGVSSGFVLNDSVPAGYTDVAVTGATGIPGADAANGYGCTVTDSAVQCVEGFGAAGLPSGGTASVTLTATAPSTAGTCLTNVADVLGNEQASGAPVDTNNSTTCVASPSISIVKHAQLNDDNGNGAADVGETITYSFDVTNTGNVTLTDVGVTDSLAGSVTCPQTTLAPAGAETCAADAPYTVTQADVDAGSVDNSATAHGTPPTGSPLVSSPGTTSTPTIPATPSIEIVKHAAVTPAADQWGAQVGDAIAYTFDVTNTGNVTLTDVNVADPTAGSVTCPQTTLAPGDTEACAADGDHTVTQNDVDAGSVLNTATAHGTPPTPPGGPAPAPVNSTPSSAIVPAAPAGPGTPPPPGGTCPPADIVINTATTLYTFDPVTGAQLSAVPLASPQGAAYGDIAYNNTGTALFGISYPSGNFLYTIDPATGAFANQTALTGAVLTDTAQHPAGAVGAPSVWNGLSPETNGKLLLGSDVTNQIYELDPTTGETTHFALFPSGIVSAGDFLTLPDGQILAVGINFDNPGDPAQSIFYLIDPTTKDLTEIGTGPQTFGAAQSDGNIYLATAGGALNYIPIASLPTTSNTDALPTQQLSNPGLGFYGATSIQDTGECNVTADTSYTVAKSASPAGPVAPGDIVTYTVTVTNTGTTPYTNASAAITDDLSQVTDDATYVPGSATASAGAVTVAGNSVSWLGPLTVAPATGSTVIVSYQVKINNSGDGDLTLLNTAVPTAAGGSCATDGGCTTTTDVTPTPSIGIVKSAVVVPAADQMAVEVGDAVAYSFVVTNTGNVTLTDVGVTDGLAGSVTCPQSTLAPGAGETCTADADYVVSQADVDAGSVVNTAVSHGTPPTPPGGPAPAPVDSPPSSVTVPAAPAAPALAIVKHAGAPVDVNGDGITDAGDTIGFTFDVTNTGNVTLADVGVTDGLAGSVTCPQGTLAPGGTETCTADAPYVVTAADVAAGVVHNSATAHGTPPTPPGGATPPPVVSPPGTTDTPAVAPVPGIAVVKHAQLNDGNGNGLADAGETITYTFDVSNTGNVALSGVGVADGLAGSVTCPQGTLAPGGTETCTADADYVVTQADVDRGSVDNSATAHGTPPTPPGGPTPGPVDSPPSATSTPTPTADPALSLVKRAQLHDSNGNGVADAGEGVTYTFDVTNTGNVTLTDIGVTDARVSGLSCPTSTLVPDESETCTASDYTVTAADVASGSVANTATATGMPPTSSGGSTPNRVSSLPSTALLGVAVITGGQPPLASTGVAAIQQLRIALGLLLGGALLLVVTRRRRQRG